ncbi:STAS domain-containing protein [Guptibacillus hwajinpoensis]|uniref:Anti-sigma factor antagonist n=1 Tax=Guptibacillus hwajinpoensis TaxID=208199 RepID=A0A0J6FY84_9BACL|nr:STAS domain-containing protein [Alkalihalobacillus macyae]KMM39312.1 anti-sigma factor antagonist [Alkalihalobacillus macyae]
MQTTKYENSSKFLEFFEENSQTFTETLLKEAVNVKDKIDEILRVGNIDLVTNAHTLVVYIIEENDRDLRAFAEQEGIAWATHSLAVSFKLEWVQAIRRTLWVFFQKYTELESNDTNLNFFEMEKQINNRVDNFLNSFFISYTKYKDSLIKAQKELVENLSVPIIPINNSVSILPLIGTIDAQRTEILEDKVLTVISEMRIQTLIMDLSGIADINRDDVYRLIQIIDGASLMGCTTVITGLRKLVVMKVTELGIKLDKEIRTLGTLQQALREYFIT